MTNYEQENEISTDEIIKGLEWCISTTTDKTCADCPFNKQNLCNTDQWALEKYALNLINRQKTEIERLRKEVNLVSIQFQDLQERYE